MLGECMTAWERKAFSNIYIKKDKKNWETNPLSTISFYDQSTGNQLGTIPEKQKNKTKKRAYQLTPACIENLAEKYINALLWLFEMGVL